MPPPKPKGGPGPTGTAPHKIATDSAPLQNRQPSPVFIIGQGPDNGAITALWSLADLPDAIARRIVVHPYSGCWVWTGPVDRDGYGRLGGQGLHRVVYRFLVGEIPADRPVIDHQAALGCIFRRCCFPGHLRPSTVRENTLSGRSFAAINAGKTRCDRGHPFDLANTYWRPNGHRDCRACIRRRVSAYSSRQRASLARAA